MVFLCSVEWSLAAKLVGSMCIDSVFVPSLVSVLRLSVILPRTCIHLCHHFASSKAGFVGLCSRPFCSNYNANYFDVLIMSFYYAFDPK